ncbi:MAG: hypothetical protein PUB75_06070 [Firmicutes bacterium]|nr:hypothetical protein [Bacillota bacterium]
MKKKMTRTIAVLMCLLTAVAFMPTFAFAAEQEEPSAEIETQQQDVQEEQATEAEPESEEVEAASVEEDADVKPAEAEEGNTEAANPINVKITVSSKGVIAKDKDGEAMAYRDVTAEDVDKDGKITYEEALIAAQNKYLDGGADANYAASSGWVNKFWGQTSDASFSFLRNDRIDIDPVTGYSSTVDLWEIADGDYLTASVNSDTAHYADWYTYFDKKENTVNAKEKFTLTLKGGQAMGTAFNNPAKGVTVGYWKDGSFESLDAKTDAEGRVKVSFAEPGTYIVTASGSVSDMVYDWSKGTTVEADCPIIAPVCIVNVRSYEDSIDDQQKMIDELKKAVAALKASAISPNARTSASSTSVKLSWTVIDGADGYEVSANGGSWQEVTGNSKSYTGLAPAAKYSYKVRGFVYLDGEGTEKYYSSVSSASAVTTLDKTAVTYAKSKKRKITVKWNTVKGSPSYQVYFSTNSKFTKGVVKYSVSGTAKTSKKLKKGKKYYVKVRAYKNGVYGPWSAVKTVKCR